MLHHLVLMFLSVSPTFGLDFLFDSFNNNSLNLTGDAQVDSSVIKLTSASNQYSIGRAFYPYPITMKNSTNSTTTISSFSTSFVFSILPQTSSSPGYGLAFFLSNSTSPAGALPGPYFGLFTNSTVPPFSPLLAVEFDTGKNEDSKDPDGNHVGINLNNIKSSENQRAAYFSSTTDDQILIDMRNGQNIQAWIDFRTKPFEIDVTIAPAEVPRPSRPLFTFYDGDKVADYLSKEMFVGFSASTDTFVEAQRVIAWSLSDEGNATDINTTKLPIFPLEPSSSLSIGVKIGISILSIVLMIICLSGFYWFWRNRKAEEHRIEEWELEYWPHRFSYKELSEATKGFTKDELLGSGGFGKVYKGTLPNNTEVAVKCVNHDSEQGIREFMAEISSMGRLQHKNLVHMRGWCRNGNELMLVYEYMPNSSLNRWIFDKPRPIRLLGWEERRRVLVDVAEGLNYLHHGWDQVVLHRDIKSSNILLDSEFRGRLGDFGLAKLYQHGKAPGTTRLVGTLGYLAPELVNVGATAASDVYSFGVTVLEVASGRKPIATWCDEEPMLVDWVRKLYMEGRLCQAADSRIGEEYNVEDMEKVLMVGLACCNLEPKHRPRMMEIVPALMGGDASALLGSLLPKLSNGSGGDGSGCTDEESLPLFYGGSSVSHNSGGSPVATNTSLDIFISPV